MIELLRAECTHREANKLSLIHEMLFLSDMTKANKHQLELNVPDKMNANQ